MNDTQAQNPPPAARCPLCQARIKADGSHICLSSGAHIPAQPGPVTA